MLTPDTIFRLFDEFGALFGPIIAGLLIAYIDKWVYAVALISFMISTLSAMSLPNLKNEFNISGEINSDEVALKAIEAQKRGLSVIL